jgi:hypothetical protein
VEFAVGASKANTKSAPDRESTIGVLASARERRDRMKYSMKELLRRARQGELFVPELTPADQARVRELKRLSLVETSRYGSWSGEEYVRATQKHQQ